MKYSITESMLQNEFGSQIKFYGIRSDSGELNNGYESLVADREIVVQLTNNLNNINADVETAENMVDDLLLETYCRYW